MTYKEIKLFSMQKMFHDITDLSINNVTKPYLDKMPYVVNCAITRVASIGCTKKKTLQITKVAVSNMINSCKCIMHLYYSFELYSNWRSEFALLHRRLSLFS